MRPAVPCAIDGSYPMAQSDTGGISDSDMNQVRSLLRRWLAPLERQLAMEPADPALHDAFERAGIVNCNWGVRAFCGFALALLTVSAIGTRLSEPLLFGPLLRVRVIAALALLVIIAASSSRRGHENARWLAVAAVLVMSLTLHALAQHSGGQASFQYDRMSLVLFGVAFLMSWGAVWSALACSVALGVFVVGSIGTEGTSEEQFVGNLGRLIVASVVTVSANVIRERRRWRNLVNARALADARAATQRTRHQYESLVDIAGSAIVVLDSERRIVEFNRGAESLSGYRRDEVLGKDYFALFRPDLAPQDVPRAMAGALAGEEIRGMESEILVRGGAHRFVLWNIARVGGPEPDRVRYIGVGQDITDRKQAEDEIRRLNAELEQRVLARTTELRESEALFRTMFEVAPIGVVTVDAAGLIVHANPAFQRMLGYDASDLRDRSVFDLTVADDRARTMHAYALLSRGRHATVQLDKRYVHREGTVVWVHEAVASIRNAQGDFAYALGMVDDVSERKRAEDRAREHSEQLAHVLRVSTMGEMAAQLAHEINQPLGAIVNYANGITMRLRERGIEAGEVGAAVTHIASEGHRAAEIIRRMRDFIRRGEVRREWADPNDVVREAAHLVEPDARRHAIPLRLVLASGLPLVEMDRIQIIQVALNLLRNGIEAMADNPAEDNELLIQTAAAPGAGIEISVRDTGGGIAETATERVFDPFFTTKVTGLGMGLSISRSIVEAHGGRLWAEANAARGTTFTFFIPRANGAGWHGSTISGAPRGRSERAGRQQDERDPDEVRKQ